MSAAEELDPVEEARLMKLDALFHRASDELRAKGYGDLADEMDDGDGIASGKSLRDYLDTWMGDLSPELRAEIEAAEPDEETAPVERTPAQRRFSGLLSDVCTALEAGAFSAVADALYDRPPADVGELRERVNTWRDDLPAKLQAEVWPVEEPAPVASIIPASPTPIAIHEAGARKALPLPLSRVRPHLPGAGLAQVDVSDIQPSMAAHGLLHPIWVRTVHYECPDPITGESTYYEIIFGERRVIAARNLGWTDIHAEIRDDLSALDIFLIQSDENEKRRGLSHLEQADMVGRLHRAEDDDEGFGLEIGEIALRLGIAESTARRRLLLSQLGETGRDLLSEGKILLGAALALAALPVTDQGEAAALILPSASAVMSSGRPRSLDDVERLLDGRFHLRVFGDLVPFDPTRAALAGAPPCAECPKRIDGRAQGELFEREVDASTLDEDARCPDRTCHRAKSDQTWEEAYEEAAGRKLRILDKADTKKLFVGTSFQGGAVQLRDLASNPTATELFGLTTYAKLLGDAAPPVALIRDPNGKARWLADWATVESALAVKTAEAKGKPFPKAKASYSPAETAPALPGGKATATKPAAPAGPDPVALERDAEELAGVDALAAIVEKAARRTVNVGFWRLLIALVVRLASRYFKAGLAAVVERRALRKDEEVMKRAGKKHAAAKGTGKIPDGLVVLAEVEEFKDEDDARALLVELIAASEGFHHFGDDEGGDDVLHLACRYYGLDLDALKDTAITGLKAAARKKAGKKQDPKPEKKAEAAPPAPAPATPDPTTAPAAAQQAARSKADPVKHDGPITVEVVAATFLNLLEVGDGWTIENLEEAAAKELGIDPESDDAFDVYDAVVEAAEKQIIAPGGGARVTEDSLLVLVAPPQDDKPKRKVTGPLAVGVLRGRILDALRRHQERAGKKAGLTIDACTKSIERDLGELPPSGIKILAKAFEALLVKDLELGDDEKLRFAPPKALPTMPAKGG